MKSIYNRQQILEQSVCGDVPEQETTSCFRHLSHSHFNITATQKEIIATLKNVTMKSIINRLHPAKWMNNRLKSQLYSVAIIMAVALIFQSCEKDECKDDPCADGCGVCPNVCETDPCGNPAECPGLCPTFDDGTLTKNSLQGEGTVVETENGMTVDGSLTITLPDQEDVVLEDAEITIEYNDDGTVNKMEGKSSVPSPTDYMEFTDPIQADFGYYSGKYLNDNWDLDIVLADDRFFLAYKIAVALEMKVGTNSDPNATKPFSIKPPVGGHIIYIYDYTDPFYYYSAAQDALGALSFGESWGGYIKYVPIQPVDEIVTFEGQSARGGTFPIFKVIDVSGVMIQNQEFNVELVEENPFPLSFSAGYGAGVNGEFDLSLPIAGWLSFGIPLGEASAAITAEASEGGVEAQAFLNGLAKPDNSWWPEFIPVKPGGQIRTSGYVQEEGQFDLELSGEFNLELPTNTYALEGKMGATNAAFTMSGSVLANDMKWEAEAEFRKNETEFSAKPPQELMDDINSLVNQNIDSAINKAETALEDYEKATADYEFELSLRGFRSLIPAIVKEAKKRIADEMKAGISSGRSQANKILSDEGLALCSDDISKQVNKLDDPYIKALDRLANAAKNTNDSETTRKEIEGALRDLAKLDRLNKSITVTITAGNKVVKDPVFGTTITPKCFIKSDFKRTVKIDVQILTSEQVQLLNTAADNVKYIAETSDIKIAAEEIWSRVPSKEIMEKLKTDIASGVKDIPAIGEVGFINHHDKNTYSYYWVVDGEKKELGNIDIFDPNSFSQAIIEGLL